MSSMMVVRVQIDLKDNSAPFETRLQNALNTAIEGNSYMDDVLIQTVSNNALKEQSNIILTNDILTNLITRPYPLPQCWQVPWLRGMY